MNLSLENKITSLRLVTILMLFYLLGYFLKAFFLFDKSFIELISSPIARTITSVFSSIVASSALLVAYVHKDQLEKIIGTKYKVFKYLPLVMFLFDVMMMLLILDVIKSKVFRLCFISVLYAVCGLLLISIFKALYKQEEVNIKQAKAKVEQKEAEEKHKCVCGVGFPTKKQLSGHQGRCKIYKEFKNN
ncbi:hypothetical protein [uncultured Tenacibaculum sp.]|uniref:hypothetical protein n=1 Tax=uncultured Tenacibaculum sp. TaxID=174713 RepID=UPI002630BD1C|nr:hypothetical protein [uncultured Tenacibaculum sp.]